MVVADGRVGVTLPHIRHALSATVEVVSTDKTTARITKWIKQEGGGWPHEKTEIEIDQYPMHDAPTDPRLHSSGRFFQRAVAVDALTRFRLYLITRDHGAGAEITVGL